MFITRCFLFLSRIQQMTDTTRTVFCVSRDGTMCNPLRDDEQVFFSPSGEIPVYVDYLSRRGRIESISPCRFRLTSAGLHPVNVAIPELCVFLTKSVFVPIAVSVLTTLVTLWIKAQL